MNVFKSFHNFWFNRRVVILPKNYANYVAVQLLGNSPATKAFESPIKDDSNFYSVSVLSLATYYHRLLSLLQHIDCVTSISISKGKYCKKKKPQQNNFISSQKQIMELECNEESKKIHFLELPLEIHLEIGSYLLVHSLRRVTLVCWELFHIYNEQLNKRTRLIVEGALERPCYDACYCDPTNILYIPEEKMPLRKNWQNLVIKNSNYDKLRNMSINKDCVRSLSIYNGWEPSLFSHNVFKTFPKLQNLRFVNEPYYYTTRFESNPNLKTIEIYADEKIEFTKEAVDTLCNFEQICIIGGLKYNSEFVKSIVQNNIATVQEMYIDCWDYNKLEQILPNHLKLRKLSLGSTTIHKNPKVFEGFKHLIDFEFYIDPDLAQFKNLDGTWFNYITYLWIGTSFRDDPAVSEVARKWLLPNLRALEMQTFCGCIYLEKIVAPRLKKILITSYESEKFDLNFESLKSFQSLTELNLSLDQFNLNTVKIVVDFATKNIRHLRLLGIDVGYFKKDKDTMEYIIDISKITFSPISTNFEILRIVRLEDNYTFLEPLEIDGFKLTRTFLQTSWVSLGHGSKFEIINRSNV